ncbi:MAG: ATP-binding protein [Planctomycetaceae bacterium]
MLFTRTIRRKMCLIWFLVLAMLVTLGAGAISGLISYRRLVRELNFSIHDAPRRGDLADAIGGLFEPLLVTGPVSQQEALARQHSFLQKLANAREQILDFHRKLDQLPPSESELARRPFTETILGQMNERLDLLQADAENLADPTLQEAVIVRMLKKAGELESLARKIPDYEEGLNDSLVAARDEYRARFQLVFLLIGLSFLLFFGLGYYVYSRILAPLRLLHQGAKRVAQGDFDFRVTLSCGDDMGELADSFNQMTARFQEIKQDLDRQVRERCKQLVRSERLAGIGFLAAGIAHEINNPLSAISMAADSLVAREGAAHADEVQAEANASIRKNYLEMIQREASRCEQITQKLLHFARGTDGERRRHDLRKLVLEVLDMVRPVSKYQDRTIDFLRTEPCYAEVNGPEIKQVILNLVANALESMSAGGVLKIRFAEQTDGVDLIFEDNGCGMTEEVMENLFDPFFTRRRDGKGTGLGMAISQRIVDEHGGTIEAFSDGINKGSTLCVHLPRRKSGEISAAA